MLKPILKVGHPSCMALQVVQLAEFRAQAVQKDRVHLELCKSDTPTSSHLRSKDMEWIIQPWLMDHES